MLTLEKLRKLEEMNFLTQRGSRFIETGAQAAPAILYSCPNFGPSGMSRSRTV